ncbi:MAG: phage tail protein [Bryobacteraceae bacterium]
MPTIHEIKELEVVQTPLILFDCELPNGTRQSWSTHSVSHGGHDYAARVLRHNLFEMRWGAEDGVDAVSKVSLTLANADSFLSQVTQSGNWKGASLTATFLFFDLKAGTAASNSMVLFRGLMNPPEEVTESAIRLSAHSRLSLQRFLLPEVRIQRRCPWLFPSTAAQREEALSGGSRGKYSGFTRCGYSAGLAGGRGNLNGNAAFTSCDYTRAACETRGMFKQDSSGTTTARFGGIEYVPASILVRGHGDKQAQSSNVAENDARYNDFVPVHYGTVWTNPPVIFARNDGNLTRLEVLLGMGEINRVLKVVVNNVEIPQGNAGANMSSTGWYNVVGSGAVSGGFNLEFTDGAGNPAGDPYGSMAYMAVSVPNRVSDGKSVPSVKVLLEGLRLPTFDADGTYLGEAFSNNPAWVMLDVLRRSGWGTDEIDFGSFARAASYCATALTVPDLFGSPRSVPRFECNLTMRRRRSVADWVRGVRQGSRIYLSYGPTGLLEARVEGTLAIQAPAKPAGSNSTETLEGGWPVYEFAESSIARTEAGGSSVRLWSASTADSPNRVTVEFQDEFNEYQQDSLSLVDVDDVNVTRQEVSVTSPALGVANFHQAARVLRLQLDRALRGNRFISFETSVRGAGLRPGDLITVTYSKEGLTRQPFRVTRIAPSLNHATVLIEAQMHDDAWYGDDPGASAGKVSRRQPGAEIGVPLPLVGSQLNSAGEQVFGAEENEETDGDGSGTVSLALSFAEVRRTRASVEIPLLSLSPAIGTTGGTIAGGQTLYYAITASDASGGESGLSFVIRASIPSATNTNRVTLQSLSFAPGTAKFHVYRGTSAQQMLRIATDVAVAATFVDNGLAAQLAGPPDDSFDHARFEWRLELQPEVEGTSFSSTTIGSDTLALVANAYAGMVVRITAGKGRGQERKIVSHTDQVVTIQGTWGVVPDATSKFAIADASWTVGASAVNGPVRFTVPNRPGATIEIVGVAVSATGRESGRELSPLTRWQIGGAAGTQLDTDVPPRPSFGLDPVGQGTVELVGVSFSTLVNTRSVFAGTLKLHFWNELAGPPGMTLSAGATASATTLSIAGGTVAEGDLLQIEDEIVEVSSGGAVVRGTFGTTAAAHDTGGLVFKLDRKLFVAPFARDFFGSPASGLYGHPIFIPDVRIAAAELFVTNSQGNSETRRLNFTATTDSGIRTLSGGQLTLQVDGPLAIQTGATPPLVVEAAHSVRDIFAVVRQAPTGAPVDLRVQVDSTEYCTLRIPAGATISNVVDGFGKPALTALSKLSLDVTSVPLDALSSPGRDLTVTLRL